MARSLHHSRNPRQIGRPCYPGRERGAVLIVTLIVLLLATLVTFSAARSSTTNMRIAVAQEIKTSTFQAAESGIMRLMTQPITAFPAPVILAPADLPALQAFNPALNLQVRGGGTVAAGDDVSISSQGRTIYRREAASVGNSIRKGGAGFQTFHYDFEVAANIATASGVASQSSLTQGVFVEAPRLN